MKILKNIVNTYPYFFNFGSMSYIFVMLNILNAHKLSIYVSLVTTFLSLTLMAFSGDFRNISYSIPKKTSPLPLELILGQIRARAAIGIFIVFIIFLFLLEVESEFIFLIILLTVRRVLDWIDEIFIIWSKNNKIIISYSLVQVSFLIPFPWVISNLDKFAYIYLVFWIFLTMLVFLPIYLNLFSKINFTNPIFFPISLRQQVFATTSLFAGVLVLRLFITKSYSSKEASNIISSMALGGFFGSFVNGLFLSDIVRDLKNILDYKKIHYFFLKITASILFIIVISFLYPNLFNKLGIFSHDNINYNFVLYGIFFSFLNLIVSLKRTYIIQKNKSFTFKEDLLGTLIFLLALVFIVFQGIPVSEFFLFFVIFISLLSNNFIYYLKLYSFMADAKYIRVVVFAEILMILCIFLSIKFLI